MLLRLFIAAMWSPAGKLTSWLLLVIFIVFVLLSHVASWARCGTVLDLSFRDRCGFSYFAISTHFGVEYIIVTHNFRKHPRCRKAYISS